MSTSKIYDLEDRALTFAKKVRVFIKKLPKSTANQEDTKQLIRSSGSIGANYIEANENVGSKDFLYRIRISRKESKESRFWLNLVDIFSSIDLEQERELLIQESTELMKIFSSILIKSEARKLKSEKVFKS